MSKGARTLSVFPLLLLFAGGNAFAQDWGQVGMHGSIIEAACAIDTVSRDQAIQMEVLPISKVIRDEVGFFQPFTVKLVNCSLSRIGAGLSAWRHFQITFDGRADSGFFGVEGSAEGVALLIVDSLGNVAVPGRPLPLGELVSEEKVLNYSMRLIGNKQILRAGDYYSAIRFKMDYY